MAKNPKIKIRLKTDVESLADVMSSKFAQERELRERELEFQGEKFQFEKKSKDRVDISLFEFEKMKKDIQWLQERNNHFAEILSKLQIEDYADYIDPEKIVVIAEDNPITLTTNLHITISLNKLDIRNAKRDKRLFQ